MNKILFLFLLTLLLTVTSTPVFAGGDKVRGDKGLGKVCQYTATDNGVVVDGVCNEITPPSGL